MKFTSMLTSEAAAKEIGRRFADVRLRANRTQAELAVESGVSKRTVERVESGESVQLDAFLRICRVLGLMERFDSLLPESRLTPMEQLRAERPPRHRASRRPTANVSEAPPAAPWRWGEDG